MFSFGISAYPSFGKHAQPLLSSAMHCFSEHHTLHHFISHFCGGCGRCAEDMRKVSSAEKRPKLRHFFISCGSAKNYLPQEKSRNCVTFCTFAEDTPYFSERVAKKTEKSLVSPFCKPPLLCYSATFRDFRGCTSAKPEKSPKLREKMIAEDMQRVSSALSSATSADFSRKFKRVVYCRSNTTTL